MRCSALCTAGNSCSSAAGTPMLRLPARCCSRQAHAVLSCALLQEFWSQPAAPEGEEYAVADDHSNGPQRVEVDVPVPRLIGQRLEAAQEGVIHQRGRSIVQRGGDVQDVAPARKQTSGWKDTRARWGASGKQFTLLLSRQVSVRSGTLHCRHQSTST